MTVITRNEAADIGAALKSVAWADEIVVVDSQSSDDTVAIAQRAVPEEYKERLRIVTSRALASGWTGKLWALSEGARAAAADAPAFFWFTDADIVHAPNTLRRLVSRAEKESLDLASLMVLLRAKTIPEPRPTACGPPGAGAPPRPSAAGAGAGGTRVSWPLSTSMT